MQARLHVRDTLHQACVSSRISTEPLTSTRNESGDAFGNRVTHLQFADGPQRIRVSAVHLVETGRHPMARIEVPWEAALVAPNSERLAPFAPEMGRVRAHKALVDYAQAVFRPGRGLLDAADELTRMIHADFVFDPGATDRSTTAREAFTIRRGVCQDFAHVAIACCRGVGLIARYVSGYLDTKSFQAAPPAIASDHPHAWYSIYVPNVGWIDYDPTLGSRASERHIVASWGRDYADVAPITGDLEGGGGQQMSVAVDVTQVSPRKAISASARL